MASGAACWGIELGAGAIKALKLSREGETLTVQDYAIVPHKRVLSAPDLDQAEARRVALGTLVSQKDLSGVPISVSVPGHSAFARFAKLPPVEPKKIPDIVKFEAVQQIPFPIEEVEWDFQTFQNSESPDVEVGIFAITRERVMQQLALWEDVGVTPELLTLGPVSVFNAMAWDLQFSEQTPGTVILDVGTTSTDLIVAEKGRVWVRTFPLGGHHFTEALVSTFKLSYLKAEKLKREAEQSKHARHVFQAMRPVFGDLAQDVQRSIGYYQNLHSDANLTRLIVFGSTFNLPGLRKYLGQQLQMEVLRLDRFKRVEIEGPTASEFHGAAMNLSTAYGLALQGLGLGTIDANLMPKTVVRDAVWAKKRKWAAAAAGIAIVGGGSAFLGPQLDKMKLEQNPKPNVVDQAKTDLSAARNEWETKKADFEPNLNAANVLKLIDYRDICPLVIDDVGTVLANAKTAADQRGGPAFKFIKLDVEYLGPSDVTVPGGVDDGGFTGGNPMDGRFDGGRDGRDRGFDDPVQDVSGPARRFRVTMDVSTLRQDNPDRFLRDTIQQWLFDNEVRDGIPFTIERKGVRWGKSGTETVPDPEADSTGGGELVEPPSRRPATRPSRGPTSGDPRFTPGRSTPRGPGRGSPFNPSPFNTEGDYNKIEGQQQAFSGLNDLAPPPVPPVDGSPGDIITKYQITWDAVITDADASEEEAL